MIDVDELIKENQLQIDKIKEIKETISLDSLESELDKLEKQTTEDGFWEDTENSSKVSGRISELKKRLSNYQKTEKDINVISEMLEILKDEPDEDLFKETKKSIKLLNKALEELEIATLFTEKYDKSNAIITIHPGAGGTEAMDWAEMIYRMYTRWAEINGFKTTELDYLAGDEAGIKSVTFELIGEYAYGYLKSENGVHRLVRISPFDAGGRRHTSFASVEVLPEIENTDVYINPDDIKMDVYRSSGSGGQHINKTSSAVRLTHIPTGIVVNCQTQRSQFQNRDTAMKMLQSKLITLKEKEHKETIEDLKGIQMEIAWGSQIRSYVFCPYTMVKDHRTNYEVGNVQKVMDGDLNEFIYEYLKSLKQNTNR